MCQRAHTLLILSGSKSKTSEILKSKKVSKNEAAKRLINRMKLNQEGHWTSDKLLSENQTLDLFSRFLNELKQKSVKKSADSTPLNASKNVNEHRNNQTHANDEYDETDAIDFEGFQEGMS